MVVQLGLTCFLAMKRMCVRYLLIQSGGETCATHLDSAQSLEPRPVEPGSGQLNPCGPDTAQNHTGHPVSLVSFHLEQDLSLHNPDTFEDYRSAIS